MKYLFIIILVLSALFSSLSAQEEDDEFFEARTTLGGYGELHYNTRSTPGEKNSQTLDFHRFVVFFAHGFSEKWSFKSELELEHNFVEGGEAGGEIALEQAFINYQWNSRFAMQAGVLLVAAGLINGRHEPPLFLSVERPAYAQYIIPATWYGNGLSATATLNGFEIKAAVMEGLIADKFRAKDGIRQGRQHGYKSDARHLLYNVQVDFSGFPGLKFGGAFVYNRAAFGTSQTVPTLLTEIHARYKGHGFIMVAEAGHIGYGAIPDGFPLKVSWGGYVDVGYNWSALLGLDGEIITWARYSHIDPAAETGLAKENRFRIAVFGVTFLPVPQVVFKADIGKQSYFNGRAATKLFNLGMGYMF